jgi:hypothetical protein
MKIKILVVVVTTALTSMISFAQNTQPAIIEDLNLLFLTSRFSNIHR